MIRDAESILRICGIGSYLHIGCGESKLVFDLLKRSVDAYGMDPSQEVIEKNLAYAPGRFIHGSLSNYPFKPESFDTIIIGIELFNFNTDHLSAVLKTLHSLTKRNLIIYFPPDVINMIPPQRAEANRLFWEKIAIEAGFRHHPRSMLHTPYHEYENEKISNMIFFERVAPKALNDFPLSWLLATRDLHMDMLREAGRRADGHVSRYVLAASKIRPGDTVLDAACGLGYGTAVLAACSPGAKFIGVDIDETSVAYANANFAASNPAISYHTCDVAKLAFIPDHSIDVVVSFETIEHLQDYDLFLTEVKRVLKPDGRLIGSVPNLWCDETGKDPNPYHYHVFDWKKLYHAIGKHFIIEDRWAQTAGGGFKLRNGKRELRHVPITLPDNIETEWWIFSACADPRSAKSIPYSNPFCKQDAAIPTVVDFGKYYANPWIYRTMVQLGERIANRDILILFCVSIANELPPGSPDHGAALCVLSYQILESGLINTQDVQKLISAINKFDENYDRQNPHAWRWAISLHYVGARILLMTGNREDALATFITCAEMDPLRFSPLLATKTISARMYAGLILAGNGDLEKAHEQFSLGVKEARRVLQSDWKDAIGDIELPLSFGLQEIAEVADIASQCAQAVNAIERQGTVPGYFWDRINLRRFGIVEWTKSVERENESLRQQIQLLATSNMMKTEVCA